MSVYRHDLPSQRRSRYPASVAAVLVAGLLACSPAHSASFGHSRLVSAVGEPLRIDVPVTQLGADDVTSLRVTPAPLSEWSAAGLVPPVDLAALHARLEDGVAPSSHVIRVWSEDVFNRPIADLLLDVHTARGVQRYQVSLLARGGSSGVRAADASGVSASGGQGGPVASAAPKQQNTIRVKKGDNMFAIAQRHAVTGVTVYQMMIALQRANPHAFIQGNLNLVRADERLVMPERSALTAISDREARRLFHEQVVAFELYRQSLRGNAVADAAAALSPTAADPSASVDGVSNVPPEQRVTGDQLKLSSGTEGGSAQQFASADADAAQSARADKAPEPASGSTSLRHASAGGLGGTVAQNLASGVGKAAYAAPADNPNKDTDAAGSTSNTTQNAADAVVDDGTQSDDQLATRKAIGDTQARVSQLEENVKNLNQALQSQGEAAKDLVIDGAIGLRQSLTDVATAVTDATIGDEELFDTPSSPATSDGTQGKPSDPTGRQTQSGPATGSAGSDSSAPAAAPGASESSRSESSVAGSSSAAEQSNSTQSHSSTMDAITTWIQGHLLGVMAGVLALIVLVIAWALRRANSAQSDSAITPEMVKEKLNQINLDLADSPVDDSSPSRS